MPELPEVETVARQLEPLVGGRVVRRLRVLDRGRLSLDRPNRLRRRRIVTVERLGKQVVFHLAPGDADHADVPAAELLFLAVHLRMTGRLLVADEPPRDARHLRAIVELDRGVLLFVDPRRFGTLTVTASLASLQPSGVDPLRDGLTTARLGTLLHGSRQPIKDWLLRQDRLVGLGNIYACEALYRAGIDPRRLAGTLERHAISRLARAIRAVLTAAIRHCGTTFSDFQGANGLTGSYQRYLTVYAREAAPCRRCATPIARLVQGQRSTFYCPACQA